MDFTFGELFAGIGGLGLGLERAGWRCRWQVEINEFRRKVLEKNSPGIAKYADVREVGPELERVDLIAGGFPCKGVSPGGKKEGLDHPESGLWREFARIIGVLRPRYVLVENSSDLPVRGLDVVLGDLSALGFDAEWSTVSACALGAPHPRRRLFLVAYAQGSHGPMQGPHYAFSDNEQTDRQGQPRGSGRASGGKPGWLPEPALGRVAVGVAAGVVRPQLEALGNVAVPQVVELIGRRLRSCA